MSEPPKYDSQLLLEQATAGDAQALGQLLERNRGKLTEIARQLISPELGKKVGASDAVQETYLDATKDFKNFSFAKPADFQAWLVVLLTNNLTDLHRWFSSSLKRNIRLERSLHDQESKLSLLYATLKNDESPSDLALAAEREARLKRALETIKPAHRQIILWRVHDELSWGQIAAQVGRSEDAVRMVWNRAIKRLKERLQQEDDHS